MSVPMEATVTRHAFVEAARWFTETVADVPVDGWELPGLGEWTVRELVAHTARAFLTIENYLGVPTDGDVDGPADYFARALGGPGIHQAVAERGRQAAAEMGDDPVEYVNSVADRVIHLVESTRDDTPCGTLIGTMELVDYLATRVLELTLHTLDLNAALGRSDVEPPPVAAELTAGVLAGVAVRMGRASELLRATTGRTTLPAGWNLLG